MLFRRPRVNPEQPLFGSGVSDFSAREVADATLRVVDTMRKLESASFVVSLVKDISDATKGSIKQAKREEALQAIASDLLLLDYPVLKRRGVPDILYVIETSTFVSTNRKAKVVKQFKEIISTIDRILN